MLNSWRSEIGKNGVSVVKNLWDSNKRKYGTDEQRKRYATKYLDGLNYLYEFPHRAVSAICFNLCTAITHDLV